MRPLVLYASAAVLLLAALVAVFRLEHLTISRVSSGGNPNDVPQFAGVVPTTIPGSTPSYPAANSGTSQPSDTGNVLNINRTVSVGTMTINVNAMECRLTQIGQDGATLNAQSGSQWCLIRVDVTNIGTTGVTFDVRDQAAYDAAGRQFSSDSDADLYVSNPFLTLNPGVSGLDVVPFELPMSDSLTRMTFGAVGLPSPVSVSLN